MRFTASASALVLAAAWAQGAQAARADGAPVARPAVPMQASAAARRIVEWARASRDPKGLPFFVIDKPRARIHVFDAQGRPRGSAPVLLGLTRGDHTVTGIGERELSQIGVHERTTPAGRFIAERGRNAAGEDIFWVDYDAAVSLHRVRETNPRERRLQRLATPTVADNRISYGCINVPKDFYERVVDTTPGSRVVVYLLPDHLPLQQVFALGDPPAPKARRAASNQGRSGP
jgi:hypothetical protein